MTTPKAAIEHRFARNILIVSTLLILYTTLFPFDFTFPSQLNAADIPYAFDYSLTKRFVFADFPLNVLLFIPFGFGLAAIPSGKRIYRGLLVGFVVLAGGLLSTSIEIAQVFLLRFPP